jgi:hypothetical protein
MSKSYPCCHKSHPLSAMALGRQCEMLTDAHAVVVALAGVNGRGDNTVQPGTNVCQAWLPGVAHRWHK